ncbi:MAG: hypothetical protein ACE5KH_05885, partial [Candidatus Geothermarchaeales archaeon]
MRVTTLLVFLVLIASSLTLSVPSAYGHGFGKNIDLPVPAYLYWYGGGSVVALSFLIIGIFVRRSTAGGTYRSYNILQKPWINRLAGSRVFMFFVKLPSVAVLALIIIAGFFGSQNPLLNFTSTF